MTATDQNPDGSYLSSSERVERRLVRAASPTDGTIYVDVPMDAHPHRRSLLYAIGLELVAPKGRLWWSGWRVERGVFRTTPAAHDIGAELVQVSAFRSGSGPTGPWYGLDWPALPDPNVTSLYVSFGGAAYWRIDPEGNIEVLP